MSAVSRVRRRNATHAGTPGEPPSLSGTPHDCGGAFELVRIPGDVRIRGTTVRVDREVYRCASCGAERATLDQVDAAREAAAEKLRREEGIMSPAEIRDLRNSLGLSQAELERALGLGPKTVVRWESGKVMPNQATSALLLLIGRDPSALEFLASRQGLRVEVPTSTSPTAPAAGEQTIAFGPSTTRWRVFGRSTIEVLATRTHRHLQLAP
jgi:HTH-type transcriptional regulator/antitoxin MqsA